jgi:hypothetical protein
MLKAALIASTVMNVAGRALLDNELPIASCRMTAATQVGRRSLGGDLAHLGLTALVSGEEPSSSRPPASATTSARSSSTTRTRRRSHERSAAASR